MSTAKGRAWSRDELILAINLYCKIPFGKIHVRNPEIIELAKLLKRTAGSISYKLANFASIDPSLPQKGASNISKLDYEVWNDFFENWDEMAFKSEEISASIRGEKLIDDDISILEGTTRDVVIKSRVNQRFFRDMILSSYDYSCCVTGIPVTELLVASHIIPWSKDCKNRLNPRNGLCLNSLHDRAFDTGLITIDEAFKIVLSPRLRDIEPNKIKLIAAFEGVQIKLPKRFVPDQDLLEYHRNNIFATS